MTRGSIEGKTVEEARRNLEKVDYQVDYVLTHTGPSDILEQMGYQIFDIISIFIVICI